jgi:hypothetical protein
MKRKFEYLRKAYWGIDGIWSNGYFVSMIGINASVIQQYIQKQGQEDRGQARLIPRGLPRGVSQISNKPITRAFFLHP